MSNDGETEAELGERLASLGATDAFSTLATFASALFPGGLGRLDQISWEATTTPPAVPARAVSSGDSQGSPDDARLRAAEVRYRTLVEQIPAVTFMAVLGEGENEVYVSPHIEALLGFTQKEWLEDPFLWYSQIHPDDRGLWIAEFTRGIRTGGPFSAECRLVARDGRIVWVRGEARLIKDELGRPLFLQGVAFDITETKKAEEQQLRRAVSRTEERYRDLVEQLGAVFWEAEAHDGRFLFVSGGSERILGFPPKRFLDDPNFWLSRVHPDDRETTLAAWQNALEHRQDAAVEFRAFRADGEIVWLQNRIHFSSADAADARLLGVVLDITERRKNEEQLAILYKTAEEARHGAEVANRVKDEFLATMSHELRTPVNAVLGWSDILVTGAGGEEMQERALVAIKRAAHAQSQMIEDLLDVSRIVTGKLNLDIRRVDLVAVIEGTLETVKLAADAKRVIISAQLAPPPVAVLGDAGRLRQVMSNLLTNAVKFTPEGGNVDVRLTTNRGIARIEVRDTGQGIAPQFLPFVFERFQQADSSSTRAHGGLGLGLAIVRHMTELHGGTVRADSAGLGEGATFTVELPLDLVPLPPAAQSQLGEANSGDTANPVGYLRDARVLVVDDDPDSLNVLGAFLARAGAEVATASSADDALRYLSRRTFDLLVSDIGMPGHDGLQLIRSIRSSGGRNRRIPAAAVTAYAREDDRRTALAAGYQAHLAKPVDIDLALTVMGQLLHDARANA